MCSSGKRITFYWRGCQNGKHIEQAGRAVVEALETNGYLLNGYLEAMCFAEIEERLERAERGQLRPIEQVKVIRGVPAAVAMFEIRWSSIVANVAHPLSGIYREKAVHVRLYFVEGRKQWIVGLHVREKVIADTDEQTRALQDSEILRAYRFYEQGVADGWGVAELR